MANDYYDKSGNSVAKGSLARSAHINSVSEDVEGGFDLLPSKARIYDGRVNYGAESGVADAYVVTTEKTMTSLVAGNKVRFLAGNANTGVATVNVDGLGVKTIKQADGNALAAGEIGTDCPVSIIYNGTDFLLVEGSTKTTKAYIDAAAAAGGSPGAINFQQLGIGTAGAYDWVVVNAAGNALEEIDVTPSRVVVTDANGHPAASTITAAKLLTVDKMPVESRTSDTILAADDNGKIIQVSGTAWTQTLTAAATLGDGWWFVIRNTDSTEVITVDPNGAETIDGETTINILPQEERLIACDGSNFISLVLKPFYMEFAASGTFTKPGTGYSMVGGEMWGGGGGGGAASTAASRYVAGGGGGACCEFKIPRADLDATFTITIAAGGAGAVVAGAGTTNGSDGGNSSFTYNAAGSKTFTAYGGAKGTATGTSSVLNGGGGGGALSAGNNDIPGKPYVAYGLNASDGNFGGGWGYDGDGTNSPEDSVFGGAGGGGDAIAAGSSIHGGGGGAGARVVTGTPVTGNEGTSVFGGNGGASDAQASGGATATNGATPAGGGGGAVNYDANGATAGDGGDGLCRVWGIV